MNTHLGFRISRSFFAVISFFTISSICGCNSGDGGAGGVAVKEPATFASWESLEIYLKEEYAASVLASDSYGASFFELDGASAPRGEFSETNVQEPGVDEADKVKTDGTYLYVADDRVVRILRPYLPIV